MIKFKELIDIYNEIRVNVRNKDKIIRFERFRMEYLVYIYNILNTDSYKGGYYYLFLIKDPKVRLIMSENIIDKIINILNDIYHLKVNKNKTMIKSNVCGISFLGYNFKVINKKPIIRISNSSKEKLKNTGIEN